VVTANIQDNPDLSDAQVRADVTITKGLGDLIGYQEIGEDADHVAVDQVLGSGWTTLFDNRATPVAYVTEHYKATAWAAVKMHDGKANVSPARYYCWVDLTPMNPGIAPFTMLNTHFVSGAWTNPGQSSEQWRKDMWNESFSLVRDFIVAKNRAGKTVVATGDFNNPDMGKFTSTQTTVAHQYYDYIIVCPAPEGAVLTKKGDARWTNLNSDHNAGSVTLGP